MGKDSGGTKENLTITDYSIVWSATILVKVHPIFTLWHYPIENSLLCLRGKYPNIDISLEHESLIPEFSNQHTNFASKIAKIALFSTIQVKWYHENMISTPGSSVSFLLLFICLLLFLYWSYTYIGLMLLFCWSSVGLLSDWDKCFQSSTYYNTHFSNIILWSLR